MSDTKSRERAEHERRLRHPLRSAEHDVEHLRDVAEDGESGATPAILTGGVLAVLIPLVAIVIGIVSLATYLATRGGG